MSVKIRLAKTGKKHQISYRIVACDSRAKRDGKFLEILGFYNPHKGTNENFMINEERLKNWVSKGARPTAAVVSILNNQNKKESTHGRIFKTSD